MIDPITKATEIANRWVDVYAQELVGELVETGLIPTRGDWGVLEAGRTRIFGSEATARRYAEKHGFKLIHVWSYDWQIVE